MTSEQDDSQATLQSGVTPSEAHDKAEADSAFSSFVTSPTVAADYTLAGTIAADEPQADADAASSSAASTAAQGNRLIVHAAIRFGRSRGMG